MSTLNIDMLFGLTNGDDIVTTMPSNEELEQIGDIPNHYLPQGVSGGSVYPCPVPVFVSPNAETHLAAAASHNKKMDQRKRKGSMLDSLYDSSCEDDLDSNDMFPSGEPGVSRKYQRQNHSEIEKRRRDKMNSYIEELSSMVPMCSAMNRKLDKLTVLRMAVQHIRSLKGSSSMYSEVSQKPSFISDNELKHLILKVAEGFLFVVGCDRGRLLYVSESVKEVLNYTQSELIGQSLFDILHPKDIAKVKEQLSASDLTPRERFIDAKTMMPVKTEMPQKSSKLSSGARRSFFSRMKIGTKSDNLPNSENVKKCPDSYPYSRKSRKSEKKNYVIIHCTGYLKSRNKLGNEEDMETDDNASLMCLVAVGRIQQTCQAQQPIPPKNVKIRPLEYTSRLSMDGKFTYVDERATLILGYLPQELHGSSVYEFYHSDDIQHLSEVHRKVLGTKEKLETNVYRFLCKDGKYLHQKSVCFAFTNPWTKEVECIIFSNTVVHDQEVSSSCQATNAEDTDITSDYNNYIDSSTPAEDIDLASDYNFSMGTGNESDKGGKEEMATGPTMPGVRQSVGRIGKQIAEQATDQSSTRKEVVTSQSHQSPEISPTGSPSPVSGNVVPQTSQQRPSGNRNPQQRDGFVPTRHNGISVHSHAPAQPAPLDTQLFENILNEQAEEVRDNPGSSGNDEAALAFLMSLLEADAGLGGPVDFNNLPWPL